MSGVIITDHEPLALAEQPPEPTLDELYDLAHERILVAWREKTGLEGGAFYLLDEAANAKEWPMAHRVEGEPTFEELFRTRADGDQNPAHVLVILPH